MRVLTFNLNGTAETKILANVAWHPLFRSCDILHFQETRSIKADPLHGILAATHTPFVFCDPKKHGMAGHGLATYVRTELLSLFQVKVRKLSKYVLWLELSCARRKVFLGNVYIPHEAAARADVYAGLGADILAFHRTHGHVLCMGDFNAHIGCLEDRQLDMVGAPVVPICEHSADPRGHNASGLALTQLCIATGMALCTGRDAQGRQPCAVLPSFTKLGAATRPDHCIMSAPFMSVVHSHEVLSHVHGSDHHPIALSLEVLAVAPARAPSAPPPGGALSRIHWDPALAKGFYAALATDPETVGLLDHAKQALLASSTLGQAVEFLDQALFSAAAVAGMRVIVVGSHRRCSAKIHQPWFDEECRAARSALRGVSPSRHQTNALKALFQRKKRQYALHQYEYFQECCDKDPTFFWRALRKGIAAAAPVVPSPEEFADHFAGVFASPPFVSGVPLSLVCTFLARPSPHLLRPSLPSCLMRQQWLLLSRGSGGGPPLGSLGSRYRRLQLALFGPLCKGSSKLCMLLGRNPCL